MSASWFGIRVQLQHVAQAEHAAPTPLAGAPGHAGGPVARLFRPAFGHPTF
jgi:hypothetical protein